MKGAVTSFAVELKDISEEGSPRKRYAIEESRRPPAYLATIDIHEGAYRPKRRPRWRREPAPALESLITIELYGPQIKVIDHRGLMEKVMMSAEFWEGAAVGILCFSVLAVLVQSLLR